MIAGQAVGDVAFALAAFAAGATWQWARGPRPARAAAAVRAAQGRAVDAGINEQIAAERAAALQHAVDRMRGQLAAAGVEAAALRGLLAARERELAEAVRVRDELLHEQIEQAVRAWEAEG